ncbi:MAG: molybdopterin molybdotransferase MoeA [Tissierellia bacterium]|nr:molybdopterin molybdotransferase MoeA [Tissierellia bacterium]
MQEIKDLMYIIGQKHLKLNDWSIMDLLKVKSYDEAIFEIVKAFEKLNLKKTINLNILDAKDYILAEDIFSNENLPHFKKSTMDGYAINYLDSNGANESIPSVLNIKETISMGKKPLKSLNRGETSQIFTGGMLPEGADAVIPIEYTEKMNDNLVLVYKPMHYLENVIDIGDDSKKGDLYFKRGKRIDSKTISALASLGISKVNVYDKLKAIIISTGDEIIDIDKKLEDAKMRDINSYMLFSLLNDLNVEVIYRKHIVDDYEKIKQEIENNYDLVIVSGSSSKGEKDYIPLIGKELKPGLLFHGISIKPGKPTSLSINDKTMILGLPGNPVSCYAIFVSVFKKAWYKYFNIEDSFKIKAKLSRNIASNGGKTLVQLVDLYYKDDELIANPIFGFSNNISNVSKAKGFFILEENSEGLFEDEYVKVELI